MVEIDGIEYLERTPLENAYDMVTYINDYCSEHQIINSKGELVQIDVNPGNPLYMILFGFAYLASVIQHLLISCANSFNVGRASDKQLLNIAEAANVRRIAPTKTSMTVLVSCPVDSEEPCLISETLTITYSSGSSSVTMHPLINVTIEPGEMKAFAVQAEDFTSMSIPEGVISGFDTDPDNLGTFHNYASVPAHEIETIANLRSRIQKRQESTSRLDRAIDAIRGLEGVVQCNIFYNYDYQNPSIQAGISVPPRQSLLIVQGYNNDIAKTFYSHLACLTTGGDRPDVIEQDFVTHSGQVIPLFIVPPTFVPIKIQVVTRYQVADDYWAKVQNTVQAYMTQLVIGQELTNVGLITLINEKYPDINLMAVNINRINNPLPTEVGNRIFTRSYELLTSNVENIVRGIAVENNN